MSMSTRTVLGIDASTQSLSAVLLQANTGEILWSRSLAYRDDPRLAGGFEHDTMIIPPREPGEAEQPPRLFIAALEALFADLKAAGFDTSAIAAINTSGQQHVNVYLNDQAKALFARLRDTASAKDTLLSLLGDSFAYGGAPIWKTANTAAEAEHIRQAVGGKEAIIRLDRQRHAVALFRHRASQAGHSLSSRLRRHTPHPADFELHSGDPGWRLHDPDRLRQRLRYRPDELHDPPVGRRGTECGRQRLACGAAALAAKLPPIAHPLAACGNIAAYFQTKYGSLRRLQDHRRLRRQPAVEGSGDRRSAQSRHQLRVHDLQR